jgi:hypothetical protein
MPPWPRSAWQGSIVNAAVAITAWTGEPDHSGALRFMIKPDDQCFEHRRAHLT